MDPIVSGLLIGLFLLPFYYILLRPLETFNNHLRYPITSLCFLYTLSLLSKDNNLVLWGISIFQSIIIWILVDHLAGYPYSHYQPQEQQHYDQKSGTLTTGNKTTICTSDSAMWIKTHMMALCYTQRPITLLVVSLHILDALFIWNPELPYTTNDYDLIGTIYNVIHLIMFITVVWRKRTTLRSHNNGFFKEETSSQAFFIYHFIVGLQPTRSLIRTVITCPFMSSNGFWQDTLLYLLSSICACIDTLPALILCLNNVSSTNELVLSRKKQEYNDTVVKHEEDSNTTQHIRRMNVSVYDPNVLTMLEATKAGGS